MRVTFGSVDELPNLTWEVARQRLADDLQSLQRTINTTWDVAHNVDGTQRTSITTLSGFSFGTLAQAPTGLSVVNDKFIYYVTDYGHGVYWDGSAAVWKFLPGDCGNKFRRDFFSAPQEIGWQLMDGTATDYLVVGATLSAAAYTTPNLTGSPAYHKSIAAYTGTISGASGPGASAVMSGNTADESTHTHGPGSYQVNAFETSIVAGSGASTALDNSTPNAIHGTSAAGSAHHHAAGSLAAAVTVDATGEPAHIGWLPYFRR